jgi:uncharacterized membrane protein YoaK (UPF0700 family)
MRSGHRRVKGNWAEGKKSSPGLHFFFLFLFFVLSILIYKFQTQSELRFQFSICTIKKSSMMQSIYDFIFTKNCIKTYNLIENKSHNEITKDPFIK